MQARKVATTSRIIYVSACRGLFLLYIFSPLKIIDLFVAESFSPGIVSKNVGSSIIVFTAKNNNNDDAIVVDETEASSSSSSLSNYNDTDGASKGVVSLLTGIINANSEKEPSLLTTTTTMSIVSDMAPKSPEELLERIRKDYVERNYLWTGDLDIDCFFNDCVFTDPTISFVGIDKFTENTQNLVPLVEKFAENYKSELISITLGNNVNNNDGDNDKHITNTSTSEGNDEGGMFVESRWRMVGSLTRSPLLFWKPKIDVMYVHMIIGLVLLYL
jgi:hypothetical protein